MVDVSIGWISRKAGVSVLFDIGLSSVVRGMDSTLSSYHTYVHFHSIASERASERAERTTRARLPNCIHVHVHEHAKKPRVYCICRNQETDFLCKNRPNEVPEGKMLS